MSIFSPSDKCKKCPVRARYERVDREEYAKRVVTDGFENLDSATSEQSGDTLESIQRSLELVANYEEDAKIVLGALARGNCEGSTKGSPSDDIEDFPSSIRVLTKFASFLTERSCNSADLVGLSADRDIAIQLKLGNWQNPQEKNS